MHNIWEFLLQTLTVSAVAVVILIIKRLFRDKLPPTFQFGIWGILGISLILPANFFGRYPIYNFANLVETAKTFLTDDFSVTKPSFFFPVPFFSIPSDIFELLYAVYFTGVVIFSVKYIFSYLKLKVLIKNSPSASQKTKNKITKTALEYNLPECKSAELKGISSPFVSGLIKPVLAVPANDVDEKVILHELIHLKYNDVFWGIVICFFRAIHWCNPLLWYCFNKINNDAEELCDSRVLSLLEGEQRREYGNILLSMTNEKYAVFPGTSNISNGGKNIRSRIETIARFKLYPTATKLVSVCILLILAGYLLIGNTAIYSYDINLKNSNPLRIVYAMAVARSNPCTTVAGAADTYAKSIMQDNGIFRAYCAPTSEHSEIFKKIKESVSNDCFPYWDSSLDGQSRDSSSYTIQNIIKTEKNEYEAYLCIEMIERASERQEGTFTYCYQKIKIFKENNRYVVMPIGDFIRTSSTSSVFSIPCSDIPAICYSGIYNDVEIQYLITTSAKTNQASDSSGYLPLLSAQFSTLSTYDRARYIYLGEELPTESINIRYSFVLPDDAKNFLFTALGGGGDLTFDESRIHEGSGGGTSGSFSDKAMNFPEKILCTLKSDNIDITDFVLTRKELFNE